MNKLFLLGIIFAILALVLFIYALNWYFNNKVSYTNNLSDKKTLIVYYSHSNHTEYIANMIKQNLCCDIAKIKAEEYENKGSIALTNLVAEHIKKDYFPKINEIDVSGYDVIFVGTPVWQDSISMPVKSFLINNNFNGKTIIPFYTFGGFVDKSKLDKQIKELSHSDSVLQSFLTVNLKFAFIRYRLIYWLNGINLWLIMCALLLME